MASNTQPDYCLEIDAVLSNVVHCAMHQNALHSPKNSENKSVDVAAYLTGQLPTLVRHNGR